MQLALRTPALRLTRAAKPNVARSGCRVLRVRAVEEKGQPQVMLSGEETDEGDGVTGDYCSLDSAGKRVRGKRRCVARAVGIGCLHVGADLQAAAPCCRGLGRQRAVISQTQECCGVGLRRFSSPLAARSTQGTAHSVLAVQECRD